MTRAMAGDIRQRGVVLGVLGLILLVGGAGCRGRASNPFTADLALAETVLRSLQELEQRRKVMETTADIGAIVSGLKFLEPPSGAPLALPETPPPSTGTPAVGTVMEEVLSNPPAPNLATSISAGEVSYPRLQGIVAHPRDPLAIVDGQTVGVGDSVRGFKVEKILQDRVVLLGPDGVSREVTLNEAIPASTGP